MEPEIKKFTVPKYLEFCEHKYIIEDEIGEGTFSKVFRAKCKTTGARVAIKAVTKTSAPNRVLEELKVLKTLKGKENCIGILDVMRFHDQILIIMPFVPFTDFKQIICNASVYDMKCYLYSLLRAVAHMHRNGIIHRDLKPGNFLYDLETQTGCLIDFGLSFAESQIEQPKDVQEKPLIFFNSIVKQSKPPGYYADDSRPQMKAPRAGTRGFRAPEVLFKSTNQDNSIDIWSVGIIMLSLMTSQYPFFLSLEDIDGLVEVGIIFGHAVMRKVAKYYGRIWKSNLHAITEEGIPFEILLKAFNGGLVLEDSGFDLLESLLDPINATRIRADEALEHPFFDEIKK